MILIRRGGLMVRCLVSLWEVGCSNPLGLACYAAGHFRLSWARHVSLHAGLPAWRPSGWGTGPHPLGGLGRGVDFGTGCPIPRRGLRPRGPGPAALVKFRFGPWTRGLSVPVSPAIPFFEERKKNDM